jgi:hypothetical protein
VPSRESSLRVKAEVSRSKLSRLVGVGLISACLLLFSLYYAFVITAGTFGVLRWNSHYYDLGADGFRHGHLYLAVQPSAALLAQANPADPANRQLWLWDALLYDRHYYIYWGPAPTLCVLAFKLLTGYDGEILDQWLVLLFALGRLWAGSALILSFSSRPGARQPDWVVAAALAVFAFASPTLFMLVRPLVYEASVAAGQCFLFCGLLAAFWGLVRARWQTPLFVLAGVCWALSLNSRVTMVLVTPPMVVITVLSVWRCSGYALRPALRAAFALGVPVLLGILAAGWYNYARFGSPTEFGVRFQLSGRLFTSDPAYFLPNLLSYMFAELEWSCRFPFAQLPSARDLWSIVTWPQDYDTGNYELGERVGGLFVTTSICWLLAVWVWRPLRALGSLIWRGTASFRAAFSHTELWLVLCSLSLVFSLLPALFMYLATMRYLADAAGGLSIAGILAGYWLLRQAKRASHPLARVCSSALYALLAAHSVFVGLCLGFSGHTDNFPRENQRLYRRLVDELSVCPKPEGRGLAAYREMRY